MILFCYGLSGAAAYGAAALFHVGILIPESRRSESQVVKGVRDNLKELGYREGNNIILLIRDAKGDRSKLSGMVTNLMSDQVNLIVTTGTRTTLAAKNGTQVVPIVFVHPADPVSRGLVSDLMHPGGNLTGVAGLAMRTTEKRLALLKEMIPKLDRIYILYDANKDSSQESFERSRTAAARIGIQVVGHSFKAADELKATMEKLQIKQGDALFHVPDDLVESEADFIFEMARQKKLPTMFSDDLWASQGALASYGPSYYQMGRQAANLVDKILRGQKPANLPIELASKFDFVINYRAARLIGLTIPPAILAKADRIIR
jgi:putative ABC transport system substrate-binding protein